VSEQYKDLGITQKKDGDYWDIEISDLDFNTSYALEAAWVYSDKTKGTSDFSDPFNFTTSEQEGLLAPHFISADLYAINSILYIKWDGLNSNSETYDSSILKQVNVWIKGGDYGETFKQVHFFTAAGLHQINATKKTTYCVKLQAETKAGKFSSFSNEFCVTMLKQPKPVYDIRHEWDNSGNLSLFWKFDPTFKDDINDNTLADSFGLQLLDETNDVDATWWTAVEKDKIPPLEQKIVISASQLQKVFGQFTAFEIDYSSFIYVRDKNLQTSFVTGYALTKYVDPLTAPIISATAAAMAYNISYTANSAFDKIYIYESLDAGATWSSTPYVTSSNPAYVPTLNTLQRSVRAKFSKKLGGFTGYSNTVTTIPIAIDPTDTTPPASAIITSSIWSGNNLSITATVSADAKKFIIRLTNGDSVGFFTKFPTTSGTSQTILLTEKEIYDTLGSYFISFAGLFISADSLDNRDSGVPFTISEKNNELNGVIPTFTLTPISNGYSVIYTLPSVAAYAKIYASSTSGFTPNDSTNLVYSGASPGIIIDSVYTTRYIRIKYFKTDGSTSSISAQQSVTPADPGMLSLIDNEVKISTDGSILAGDFATSGGRAILNKTGLYVYNTGSSPTTQIVANAIDGSPTFLTTNAKIADWKIYSNKIENQLITGITKYAGLSASGTYAFWAGSTTSGGDAQSEFSVTQGGAVQAKNITISGGSLTVGASTIAATTGKLTATDAEITGKITANSGSITGNLNIESAGALIAGTLGGPRVQINSSGLFAYGNLLVNNLPVLTQTTQIIGNAATDSPTFITTRALVGNWAVGTDSLSAGGITLNSSTPSIIATSGGSYVGIKPRQSSGTDIVLWTGATSSPAINSAASGQAGFQVNANGQLYATGAIISGVITVESGSSLGGLLNDTSKVYYSPSAPTAPTSGFKVGDSWVDTANSNQLKIWSGTAWVVAQDSESVKSVAASKTKTTYGPTQPTSPIAGDVWFDTNSGINYFKVYSGTAFVRMKDSDITLAQSAAATAQSSADSKAQTTFGSTAPVSPRSGDIWFDTTLGYFKRYNGTTFDRMKDADITAAMAAAVAAQGSANTALSKALLFGVDGSLVSNMIIENSGAAIYSKYNSGGVIAKDSYASTNAGFYLGWDNQTGVLYPAFNIGNANSYMKWSNYDQTLRIKGNITLNASSDIDGVSVSSIKSGATAGSSALQPGGDLTGKVGGVAVADIKSGASAGGTAAQPGNGVSLKNDGTNQINQIDLLASGIKISSAASGTRIEISNSGLYLYKGTTLKVGLSAATGDAEFAGTITSSGLYLGSSTSATDKILSTGQFSLGNGSLTYPGSGSIITVNASTFNFSGASEMIDGDSNNYGGDSTVVLGPGGNLTKGRAFHYGGSTVPLSSNTSRSVKNSATGQYVTIPFVSGDIWITVD
jgi:hypothetical protein